MSIVSMRQVVTFFLCQVTNIIKNLNKLYNLLIICNDFKLKPNFTKIN